MVLRCGEFVAFAGTHGDPVEKALGVAVEIAQAFGLQAVGDHAKEEVAGKVVGGLMAEYRLPAGPQAGEVEIAHARDLFLQVDYWRGHDQAARRDLVLVGGRASGPGIR
jgi:hypothetical protein